ncbi:hypothetical protein EJ05DRAFT_388799 [Pseudovirgaria hyperparasitica]|uniref:Glycosyl transferase CAP10 domain-containing protein n=1 Tax=Pseudovirgaria hyperparasitica TaxID=470096 RepID=A0A6A6W4C0_9PEZI|nr:uncharacterized protein EJ05DRAFT_388799 [Pseudovirgaria hyperparasitica]KAF2757405.1 hypothetical protein EJ05DRAFT_388799 [Pseudovirgaria hyperparasitica]
MAHVRFTGKPMVACILITIFALALWSFHSPRDLTSVNVAPHGSSDSPPPTLDFDSKIHANDHSFSSEQCDAAFPELYDPITAAVRRRNGSRIRLEDIAINEGRCMLRILVYDNEVFVVDKWDPEGCYIYGFKERAIATLSLIQRAVMSAPPKSVPNAEFAVSLDDLPLRSKNDAVMFALTRQETEEYKDVWLIPDFGYWSWILTRVPSYQRMRQWLFDAEVDAPFINKMDKAVWRGNLRMSGIRYALRDIAAGKEWSDIEDVDVASDDPDYDSSKRLTIEDMCKYKFAIHTEGTSYSGRLKFLQACKSVVVAHPLTWQEFHTHLLIASGKNQNYVRVEENWSTLDRDITHLIDNPLEAEAIATRSFERFGGRYLTPAAISCYWRRLLREWATIQDFEPELYKVEDGKKVLRGVPYSEIVVKF